MQVTLYGAAGEVTGSAFLVDNSHAQVMVDFGLFQGSHTREKQNKIPSKLEPRKLDAVVLTHAHLDHIGRLPLLIKSGYRKQIYATPGTIDLAKLILEDSARIEANDKSRINRKRQRAGLPPIEPLYTTGDVQNVLSLLRPLPYRRFVKIAHGIEVCMEEAGHILGSASAVLRVNQGSRTVKVVFSGDLGSPGAPLVRDPAVIKDVDAVFMESTYGDREHKSLDSTTDELRDLVKTAIKGKGKILVPTFAVGRAQVLLYFLLAMMRSGELPRIPIYLDSPMAIEATKLYYKHFELMDREATELRVSGQLSADLKHVTQCVSPSDSQALNEKRGPCLILAGSGMCHGGRIVHHLKHNLWKQETLVIIVGYQATGTLGRRLLTQPREVSLFGERIAVRATIRSLGGFSAHAGQSDLLKWFSSMAPSTKQLFLVHGEPRPRKILATAIKRAFKIQAKMPNLNQTVFLQGR